MIPFTSPVGISFTPAIFIGQITTRPIIPFHEGATQIPAEPFSNYLRTTQPGQPSTIWNQEFSSCQARLDQESIPITQLTPSTPSQRMPSKGTNKSSNSKNPIPRVAQKSCRKNPILTGRIKQKVKNRRGNLRGWELGSRNLTASGGCSALGGGSYAAHENPASRW